MRSATHIFRPEVYDTVFPPTPIEQALQDGLEGEGEPVSPEDFDSINEFIKGLGELKSTTIPEDEGWV